MKTATILIAASILAPGTMLLGVSAIAATSASIAIGISAIALNDYGTPITNYGVNTKVKATQALPLAA
ncbi:MAG: hypothetical protein J6386_06320 [Candidatus Synoicihabitans palmerolidicus]|nr:hypothetical protein [Candidatus Synoicihabitans palmerolidicus]